MWYLGFGWSPTSSPSPAQVVLGNFISSCSTNSDGGASDLEVWAKYICKKSCTMPQACRMELLPVWNEASPSWSKAFYQHLFVIFFWNSSFQIPKTYHNRGKNYKGEMYIEIQRKIRWEPLTLAWVKWGAAVSSPRGRSTEDLHVETRLLRRCSHHLRACFRGHSLM